MTKPLLTNRLTPNTEVLAILAPADPDGLHKDGITQDGVEIFSARWIGYGPEEAKEFDLLRNNPRLSIVDDRDFQVLPHATHHLIRFTILPEQG